MEKGVGLEKSFYNLFLSLLNMRFIHKVISGRMFFFLLRFICLFWWGFFAENVMFDQPLFYFIVLNMFNKKLLTKKLLTEVSLPLLLLAFFLLTVTTGTLSLTPVPLCHWISCWLQPSIPTSTVLCPQREREKKRVEAVMRKEKGK